MPSQRTLVWVGAGALAVVIAGAGAVVWTHPDFLEQNPADLPLVARAPAESKPPIVPTAPPVPATPPAASVPATGDKTSTPGPAFDIVNVDPSGEAVIAGRAAPNAKVELHDGGKTVAEATADAAGQFVIIPPALAPGDHSLSLAAGDDKAHQAISSTVAVSVPAQETKVAAAAPTNPNGPAPSALGMRTLATPSSVNGSRVAIQSVEADAVGGLVAKGSAEPNATVRLYLNQADLAEAKTQSDGRWSLTIQHGMSPGGYVMRADEIGHGDASAVASADTPFDYPETAAPASPAAAIPASASAQQSSASSPADPVIGSIQTKRVVTGHTLWALSQSYYGDPTRYPAIVEANRAQIHNPNVIFPGQVFVVPKSDAKQ
ncbi:MAG TPA: Ig-like domain-containing protein [Roseiarcus sp.]|nr:Ig-like domain-containing protein [Roseiarcus sp.]